MSLLSLVFITAVTAVDIFESSDSNTLNLEILLLNLQIQILSKVGVTSPSYIWETPISLTLSYSLCKVRVRDSPNPSREVRIGIPKQ